MSFKFDRQHLTGQQQAIITQRDKADEELRKQSSVNMRNQLEERRMDLLQILHGFAALPESKHMSEIDDELADIDKKLNTLEHL